MVMSALALADALVDRAGGVADLQSHVPQAIEDRFGDRFAPRGLLVGQQEQQIDVGAGRQHAAPVAAGGDDRHALGFGRILRGIEMLHRELEQQADDLVLHEAEPFGAPPAVPVLEQHRFRDRAAFGERGLAAAARLRCAFHARARHGLWQAFRARPRRQAHRTRRQRRAAVGRLGSAWEHRDSRARGCCHGLDAAMACRAERELFFSLTVVGGYL